MIREVYLDNSATTKPYPEVVEAMVKMLTDNFGNPSSLHIKGINAEREINKSRENIAKALGARKDEIYFTSGGTEANNIAIMGTASNIKKGAHLITSSIEHPSILETFKHMEEKGFDVSYIRVDKYGRLDLNHLEDEIREDTFLISIMHVNNEVGTIQPIKEIRQILDSKNSKALFHVDAIQSFGKIPFTPGQMGIDLLTISAHKLHGPKGIGALYIKKGLHIKPIIYGGSQEIGIRSGTENVPGIIGFGKATEITFENFKKQIEKMNLLKAKLKELIMQNIEQISLNGGTEDISSPHILNISFSGVKAEVLLHALEDKGVFISTGSACSSNRPSPSHVLAAMGVKRESIGSAVRFSVSSFNSIEDIEYCVEKLSVIIQKLRKYIRR